MSKRLLAMVALGWSAGLLFGQTPVTVYEDEGAVPHFLASDDRAVLWALGRQHMVDYPVATAFNLRKRSTER